MEIKISDNLLSIRLLYNVLQNFENFRCAVESRDELTKALEIKMLEKLGDLHG